MLAGRRFRRKRVSTAAEGTQLGRQLLRYRPDQYCFVPTNDFGDQRIERIIVPVERNVTIVNQTINVTNITYNNTTIRKKLGAELRGTASTHPAADPTIAARMRAIF